MASTINASTSPAAIVQTADGTANLSLQSNGTTIAAITSTGLAVTGTLTTNGVTGSPYTMKNRIINGAMAIDQRAVGASTTPSSSGYYSCDRWQNYMSASSKYSVQQNAGSVTPPTGYKYYLGITSTSSYTVGSGETFSINQQIEGYNIADLGWGTANAQTVTLSFWVRSSLTGTFGGAFRNDNGDRSYPFTYTISVANTWEQKSITISGSTTGTWVSTNGPGIQIWMGLGVGSTYSGTAGSWASTDYRSATGATSVVGTNGATFYLTGVQLEVGSNATQFEWRPYGTELALCQRYYQKTYNQSVVPGTASRPGLVQTIVVGQGGTDYSQVNLFVPMRTGPTISIWDGNANANAFSVYAGGAWTDNTTSSITSANAGEMSWSVSYTGNPFSTGMRYMFHFTATAEL